MTDPRLDSIDAVVFDLDDTLYAKVDWAVPALEFAAGELRMDKHRVWELATQYVHDHGCADAGIYNFVLLGCGQSDSALNIRALMNAVNFYRPQPGDLQLYPGVVEVIIALSAKRRLAIMADGEVDCQRAKVVALGLEEACSVIVYSDEIAGIQSRRPDARPYLRVLELLQTRANRAMFVADNPYKDFICARQLGFVTVRMHTGEYANSDAPSPAHAADYDLTALKSLPELLAKGRVSGVFNRAWRKPDKLAIEPDQSVGKP